MISGVVLTRNEESRIEACLRALRPHVGEIILIDTDSTDRTVERARPLVDKVLTHPHVSNFDAVRNLAIPVAVHDWMWFADADEIIPAETGRLVNELVRTRGGDFEAINIPFKTYFCGQWMQHCGWWPGFTMPRVLKRGYFQFSKRLHAGVDLRGRQIYLSPNPSLAIDHFSYQNIEHYLEKLNQYTSTEALQLIERGNSFDWQEAIRSMTVDLWTYYEANRGSLDGELGWILSWLAGQYRWLTHAKLAAQDRQQGKALSTHSVPENLDTVLEVMRNQLCIQRKLRPELPLGIVWRSPVWDPSGYAEECRTFLKSLAGGLRPLRLEEIHWSTSECSLPDREVALLRSLTRAERPRFSAAITDCIPTICKPDPCASLNILRTTFETDRIPESWLAVLSQYDEVWIPSHHNYTAFYRSGIAPEKLRVVPSCIDTECYRSDGARFSLPPPIEGKFVFLSVLDWQHRKGWDLLLRAYCEAFQPADKTGLYLKLTRSHGYPMNIIVEQAESVLKELGQSLSLRPDIVLSDATLDSESMASLYRSVQAFVLASRGEGWGRPYMEAMASGLPTIGTRATGNLDFMDDSNSFLIDASEVDVPEQAAREIYVYSGHRWHEPSINALRSTLRQVIENKDLSRSRADKAVVDIRSRFCLAAGRRNIQSALADAEQRFAISDIPPVRSTDILVELEGEFFAGHSFSKINEQIALEFIERQELALSLHHRGPRPASDNTIHHAYRLRPYLSRRFEAGPEIIIRHSYPPNWIPPTQGKWVHIQPWEFGQLPRSWVEPLRDRVDEIWVPSNYVKQVYLDSGIPAHKIQVIPWGIDPAVYSPEAPRRILPTTKQFAFLFVGGTIPRKGFDILLNAYLNEFRAEENVCLVVKDTGANSFYSDCTHRPAIRQAMADRHNPKIVYWDESMTEGQLASLYTACHCFVVPYRGEGFGLPILEAMASGLPVIVPRGGPSDDFVTDETGIMLPAQVIQDDFRSDMDCSPMHLEVSPVELRRAMRHAFENADTMRLMGQIASRSVRDLFTWENTVALMAHRLSSLAQKNSGYELPAGESSENGSDGLLAAYIVAGNSEHHLADCLARLRPFVKQLVVCDLESTDRSRAIAKEYSADLVCYPSHWRIDAIRHAAIRHVEAPWWIWIDSDLLLGDRDMRAVLSSLTSQASTADRIEVPLRYSKRADGTRIESISITRPSTDFRANGVEYLDRRRPMFAYGRTRTINKALGYFRARQGRLIVEIGSIRQRDNVEGDGYSTIAWAQHAERVYSVDIDPAATALTTEETSKFGTVTAITQDGVDFLSTFGEPIDLLYLDAWDAYLPGSQDDHLRAYLAARKNLHSRSLILIDDTDLGDYSKGKLVIPQAVSDGLTVLFSEDKQTLLGKP